MSQEAHEAVDDGPGSDDEMDTMPLALRNPHPLDRRCTFNQKKHVYRWDGERVPISVSGVWAQFFGKFDVNGTIDRCFPRWQQDASTDCGQLVMFLRLVRRLDEAQQRAQVAQVLVKTGFMDTSEAGAFVDENYDDWRFRPTKSYGPLINYCEQVLGEGEADQKRRIAETWAANGNEASATGTRLHRMGELHQNGICIEESGEFPEGLSAAEKKQHDQYLDFVRDHPEMEPFRTEWNMVDPNARVAGQADCIMREKETGRLIMFDWKFLKEPLSPSNPYRRFGKPPFDKTPDTKFGHYSFQQNLYKYILGMYYGISISEMYLVQFGKDQETYNKLEVPCLQREVAEVMEKRAREFSSCSHSTDGAERTKRAKTN